MLIIKCNWYFALWLSLLLRCNPFPFTFCGSASLFSWLAFDERAMIMIFIQSYSFKCHHYHRFVASSSTSPSSSQKSYLLLITMHFIHFCLSLGAAKRNYQIQRIPLRNSEWNCCVSVEQMQKWLGIQSVSQILCSFKTIISFSFSFFRSNFFLWTQRKKIEEVKIRLIQNDALPLVAMLVEISISIEDGMTPRACGFRGTRNEQYNDLYWLKLKQCQR